MIVPAVSFKNNSISGFSDEPTTPGNLSVEVILTLRGIEELRPTWEKWSHNLKTDIRYYLYNLRNDPAIVHPYVLAVYEDGIVQALLVGQIRIHKVSTVIMSFIRIRSPKVKVLEIVAGGRIGRQSTVIDTLLALKLLEASQTKNVDLLCFHRMPLGSELFRVIKRLPGLSLRIRVPHVFYYSVMTLNAPEVGPGFSGKKKREIRRKTRILERSFPGKFHVQCFAQPSELAMGLRDALLIDCGTWQHYLGNGLVDAMRSYDHWAFCARQGWLRIYVAYIDHIPVAFLLGQHYNQTFYCQHAGYRREFSSFSVGSLLTAWVLNDLATAGVEQVDLGEGEQEHNRRLGCQRNAEGTVHLYSLTLLGMYLNIIFAVSDMIRMCGERLIKAKWVTRANRTWKRLLISRLKSHAVNSVTNQGITVDS